VQELAANRPVEDNRKRMDIPFPRCEDFEDCAGADSLETPIGEEEDFAPRDFIEDKAVVSPSDAVIT